MSFVLTVTALVALAILVSSVCSKEDYMKMGAWATRAWVLVVVVSSMCVPVCLQYEATAHIENTHRAVSMVLDDAIQSHSLTVQRTALGCIEAATAREDEHFAGFALCYAWSVYRTR